MVRDDTQTRLLRILHLPLTIRAMPIKRHVAWLVAAAVFAAFVLPFVVYYTGEYTLGQYSRGGPLRFVADFYADLARLRPAAWTLLLGPVALVLFFRVLVAYAWPRRGD
jgi:hypothetical protein